MSDKRVTVGQSSWQLPEGDVEGIVKQIREAVQNGSVADLELLDESGRTVRVLFNGKAVQTVELDLGEGARPSEIS
jgi:hypothetical protein